MSTQGPTAGWHPDPAQPGTLRWWDGTTWTDQTAPMPGAAGGPPPGGAPVGGAPGMPYGQAPYTGNGQAPYGPVGNGPSPYASGGSTFFHMNTFSLATFGVVVLYIVIAAAAHLVFVGLLPILLSVRAIMRKEKLAPVAIAVAVIGLVVGITALAH